MVRTRGRKRKSILNGDIPSVPPAKDGGSCRHKSSILATEGYFSGTIGGEYAVNVAEPTSHIPMAIEGRELMVVEEGDKDSLNREDEEEVEKKSEGRGSEEGGDNPSVPVVEVGGSCGQKSSMVTKRESGGVIVGEGPILVAVEEGDKVELNRE